MAKHRTRLGPFHHPTPDQVDYARLIEALRAAHAEALRFWQNCGLRNPAANEAEALMLQLRAVAALTRVPGVEAIVAPPTPSHTAGGTPTPGAGAECFRGGDP